MIEAPILDVQDSPWLPVVVPAGRTHSEVVCELRDSQSFFDYLSANFREKMVGVGKKVKTPFYVLYAWEQLGYDCAVETILKEADEKYRLTHQSIAKNIRELNEVMRQVFCLTIVLENGRIKFSTQYAFTQVQEKVEKFMQKNFTTFLDHAESLASQGVDVQKLLLNGTKQDKWQRVQRLLSAEEPAKETV